ncbi:MAG TPA: glycosyltransferase family 2 protein [Caulobacteraceae bacterium]|nr:glycosyltransferase family 2 protein [Caulobacteraceae bacterium]
MGAGEIELQLLKQAARWPRGPVVFCVQRDEHYFLPHFFAHYRRLGVDGFLVYDDSSDAQALAFLMRQPDCAVLRSQRQFGEIVGREPSGEPLRLGTAVKMRMPEELLAGRWVLTVDADEFLVLPSGVADLPQLIERLERAGQPYLTAPMVDFYGETLGHRRYGRDLDPFAGNPFFDAGPYYRWNDTIAPDRTLGGGVRLRLLAMLAKARPDLVAGIYGDHPIAPAKSWKAPLLKHGCGVVRHNDHELSVAPRPHFTAALAHFKFYPDLDDKIEQALARRQYYNGSMEYAFLKAATETLGRESLIAAQTRRYDGAASLEAAGLLGASAGS